MAGTAELLYLIDSLQHAVAVPPHDPGWRDQLDHRLTGLRRAFAEHVGVTEGPEGLYHELVDQAPRLAAGVHGLMRDHRALLSAMDGLRARVCPGTPDGVEPDVDQLLRRAHQLIQHLYEHRQRGADLVYEAYGTDIGGET
jgi:hypothetical protein